MDQQREAYVRVRMRLKKRHGMADFYMTPSERQRLLSDFQGVASIGIYTIALDSEGSITYPFLVAFATVWYIL